MKEQFGLIGFPLSHSFSKSYFSEKFLKLGIQNCSYENFELSSIDQFPKLLNDRAEIAGLSVTIPYKESIIPFLDSLSKEALEIGAVNTIQINKTDKISLVGHNTDIIGFRSSLLSMLGAERPNALILGTGGAAKAVKYVLDNLDIGVQYVSRNPSKAEHSLSYQELNEELIRGAKLIVNTSPLGMYPNMDLYPDIPYAGIGSSHFLFDLIYNPALTSFLKKGMDRGASVKNGLEMLALQADASWEIWNS